MGMTIDELKCIIGEYKLRIPPTVYYELLADLEDAEFIPKADYENRLKADLKAILVELQLEIEEHINPSNHTDSYEDGWSEGAEWCIDYIQEKINSLKEK